MLPREHRLITDDDSGDTRGCFQRDRDRILYSAQFRRLSGVTQVTSPTELHSFHNRLTHTLEVAQIARRMAERLQGRYPEVADQIDPDVCEAAALAHDLGHPPFGHCGEKALDAIAKDEDELAPCRLQVADGYEGNAQTFRILTKLAVRSPDYLGLNLTAATLRASLKYPCLMNDSVKDGKFGVFETERNDFETVWEGLPAGLPTLEAQIMDWADDIAYSVHDMYDFILSGLIPIGDLTRLSAQELKVLLSGNPKIKNLHERAFDWAKQVLLIADTKPNLQTTSRFSSQTVAILKQWVSYLITRYSDQEVYLRQEGDSGAWHLKPSTMAWNEVEVLKALTYHYAIGSPALAVRQHGEQCILRGLFTYFLLDIDGTGNTRAESKHGPRRLISDESLGKLIEGEPEARVICDIISSMTDAQAVALYHKLSGNVPASVLDLTTPSVL